jgi:membrane protein YdbS with pleckstrin-like domain
MIKQIHCTQGTLCFAYPLEKRKVIKKTLVKGGGIIFIFLIFLILLVAIKLQAFPFLNFFSPVSDILIYVEVLLLLLILVSLFSEILYFRNYFYDLKEDGLIVRKGVITKHEVTVPLDKIQDIYVDQDFLDRIFGLYDLHIATAGFGSSDIHIDGINYMSSETLRELLLGKTGKAKKGESKESK